RLGEGLLAGGLAGEVLGRVGLRDVAVRRGVPRGDVDPVDHAVQIGAPVLEHPLEAAAELGGLDLLRVRLADRVEDVGEDEPALEEIELSVELEAGGGEEVPTEG